MSAMPLSYDRAMVKVTEYDQSKVKVTEVESCENDRFQSLSAPPVFM